MERTSLVYVSCIPHGTTKEELHRTFEGISTIEYILYPLEEYSTKAVIKFADFSENILTKEFKVNGSKIFVSSAPTQAYSQCSAEVDPLIVASIADVPDCIASLKAEFGVDVDFSDSSGQFVLKGLLVQLQCAQARLAEIFNEQKQLQLQQLQRITRDDNPSLRYGRTTSGDDWRHHEPSWSDHYHHTAGYDGHHGYPTCHHGHGHTCEHLREPLPHCHNCHHPHGSALGYDSLYATAPAGGVANRSRQGEDYLGREVSPRAMGMPGEPFGGIAGGPVGENVTSRFAGMRLDATGRTHYTDRNYSRSRELDIDVAPSRSERQRHDDFGHGPQVMRLDEFTRLRQQQRQRDPAAEAEMVSRDQHAVQSRDRLPSDERDKEDDQIGGENSATADLDYCVVEYILNLEKAKIRLIEAEHRVRIRAENRVSDDIVTVTFEPIGSKLTLQHAERARDAFITLYQSLYQSIVMKTIPVLSTGSYDANSLVETIRRVYFDQLFVTSDSPGVVTLVGQFEAVAMVETFIHERINKPARAPVSPMEHRGLHHREEEVNEPQDEDAFTYESRGRLKVRLYTADITRVRVDVIVNAANESLANYSGVAGAIERAGGPQFRQECEELIAREGRLKVAEVVHTMARGDLRCRYVVHTVAPFWLTSGDKARSMLLLQKAVENVLDYSNRLLRATTIAIPALGTGMFEVPLDICAQAMFRAINELAEKVQDLSLREVHLVNNDPQTTEFIQTVFIHLLEAEQSAAQQLGDRQAGSPVPGSESDVRGSPVPDTVSESSDELARVERQNPGLSENLASTDVKKLAAPPSRSLSSSSNSSSSEMTRVTQEIQQGEALGREPARGGTQDLGAAGPSCFPPLREQTSADADSRIRKSSDQRLPYQADWDQRNQHAQPLYTSLPADMSRLGLHQLPASGLDQQPGQHDVGACSSLRDDSGTAFHRSDGMSQHGSTDLK